jgi:hypothetical protein
LKNPVNLPSIKSLILGLEAVRNMYITKLVVFWDFELVVKQIKGCYQTRHPRMRSYRNQVWDLIDNFYKDFNIIVFSREFNQQASSLAIEGSTFKTHGVPQMRYEIEMRYIPSIPDNINCWQVFEDYQKIHGGHR